MINMENTKLNIIFIGSFTFPYGMGGTELVKRFVDYCTDHDCKVKVFTILKRLNKRDKNRYKGMYNNQVPYLNLGIITGFRIIDILQYPIILFYSLVLLLLWKERNIKNILYVYDNINLFTALPVLFAKSIGYKVILEIVEDYALNEDSTSSVRKINLRASIFLEKKIVLFTDSIIVVSKYLENKFRVLCGEKIPVLLIPVSTDMNNNFAYRKEKRIFNFLYAGSFAKKDGLETLVKAFDIFNNKYGASKLNLIGDTNHHSYVQELLINDNIKYLGYVEDYFNILFKSDVLCMTRTNSKFANAGFPHKIAEYLSTGIPVICSDVSDIKCYLENKKDAMIIVPDNFNELFEAMEFLYLNKERAYNIGNNGKSKARTFFNSKRNGKLFLDFIRQ